MEFYQIVQSLFVISLIALPITLIRSGKARNKRKMENEINSMSEEKKAREITRLTSELQQSKTNHILHLILSIVTAGIWVPIWLVVTIIDQSKRKKINNRIQMI